MNFNNVGQPQFNNNFFFLGYPPYPGMPMQIPMPMRIPMPMQIPMPMPIPVSQPETSLISYQQPAVINTGRVKPLTKVQVRKIARQLNLINAPVKADYEVVNELFALVLKLRENSLKDRNPRILITNKSGSATDQLGELYDCSGLKSYKIHLITNPAKNCVTAFISSRVKNADGLPLACELGAARVFTVPQKFDFVDSRVNDCVAFRVSIKEAGRLRLQSRRSISEPQNYANQLRNFRRDIDFLKKLETSKRTSSLYDFVVYEGHHNKQPIQKITSFEMLHPHGTLIHYRHALLSQPLSEDEFRAKLSLLFKTLAEEMVVLKRNDIIHNDLSLKNIAVSEAGEGIVRDYEHAVHLDEIKPGQQYQGTPDYIAPERLEQRLLHRSDAVSFEADIWSMGMIFYRMIAGPKPVLNHLQSLCNSSVKMDSFAGKLLLGLKRLRDGHYQQSYESEGDFAKQDQRLSHLRNLNDTLEKFSTQLDLIKGEPGLMPLPGFQQKPSSEDRRLKFFKESTMAFNSFRPLFDEIFNLASSRAFSLNQLNQAIESLETNVAINKQIAVKILDLIKEGVNEWSNLPLSDDRLVQATQRMLRPKPEERITPAMLVAFLN